ncbi:MAG: hypothetical protein ABIM78_00150 [candidate division WOR-3 bacterium]
MILLFFIAQITSETQKIIYYEVPSKFIPYISSSKAYMVPENYKIRKGDILNIIFFGTYNQVYIQQVTNTGEIWIITTPTSLKFSSSPLTEVSGPNLGFFKVDGKTLKEIEEEINKKIKEKFEGTIAKVYLAEIAPIEIHLVGEKGKRGVYHVEGFKRVSELLKEAGFNDEIKIVLLKRNNKIDTLQMEKYFKTGDLSQNPYLEDGDIIILWDSK